MCESPYITCTNTHILTGKRYTENNPPINLEIGDHVPIRVIQIPGIRKQTIEIDPIFTDDTCVVRVTNIYEKSFKDLNDDDLDGISPIIKNDIYVLSLYLAIIYDKCVDDITNGYVTIVKTQKV